MTDLASMQFQSAKSPDEKGTVRLHDDGTIQVDPSEPMLETIAKLEHDAVKSAWRRSSSTAGIFILIGLIIAAIGWIAGRKGGKLREYITDKRSLGETELKYDSHKGVELKFTGDVWSRTSLYWAPGEYNSDEAEKLYDTYKSLGGK
jgi:hypothetical protein